MGPNETVLREIYERYGAGDAEYMFKKFADNIVWKSPGNPEYIATAGVRRGAQGVREFLAKLRPEWELQRHEVLEVIAQEDTHFALRIAVVGVHRRTHGRVQFDKVDLVTMANGKFVAYEEFFDTAPLERAAGHDPSEH